MADNKLQSLTETLGEIIGKISLKINLPTISYKIAISVQIIKN